MLHMLQCRLVSMPQSQPPPLPHPHSQSVAAPGHGGHHDSTVQSHYLCHEDSISVHYKFIWSVGSKLRVNLIWMKKVKKTLDISFPSSMIDGEELQLDIWCSFSPCYGLQIRKEKNIHYVHIIVLLWNFLIFEGGNQGVSDCRVSPCLTSWPSPPLPPVPGLSWYNVKISSQ